MLLGEIDKRAAAAALIVGCESCFKVAENEILRNVLKVEINLDILYEFDKVHFFLEQTLYVLIFNQNLNLACGGEDRFPDQERFIKVFRDPFES